MKRTITIEIDDATDMPFLSNDILWMTRQIEDALREQFDVRVGLLTITNHALAIKESQER